VQLQNGLAGMRILPSSFGPISDASILDYAREINVVNTAKWPKLTHYLKLTHYQMAYSRASQVAETRDRVIDTVHS
jgi:hypothetical protein